jgi:anti-sigma-K factor RskA
MVAREWKEPEPQLQKGIVHENFRKESSMNRAFFGRTAVVIAAAAAVLASIATTTSAQPTAKPLTQITHVAMNSSPSPFPQHE